MDNNRNSEYIGFGLRMWAWCLDGIAFVFFSVPVLYAIHGRDYFKRDIAVRGVLDVLNTVVLSGLIILLFWFFRSATPGKMGISAKIVDAKTEGKPAAWQFLLRFSGYFLAALPLGLGFLWIIFDPRKQGWHDKLARTVVIRAKKSGHASATDRGA